MVKMIALVVTEVALKTAFQRVMLMLLKVNCQYYLKGGKWWGISYILCNIRSLCFHGIYL